MDGYLFSFSVPRIHVDNSSILHAIYLAPTKMLDVLNDEEIQLTGDFYTKAQKYYEAKHLNWKSIQVSIR